MERRQESNADSTQSPLLYTVCKKDLQYWRIGVDNVLDSVEIYDPDTDLWEAGPALPNPVYEAQAVSYQNTLYLLGGVANAQVFTLSADPGAQWEILEGVMVSEEIRQVFPAPLLTSEMLFCEENI